MASIIEIEVSGDKAHLMIDDTEYMALAGRASVTVLVGRWCHDRRALGKTFWKLADLEGHYKRHGKTLSEYVARICPALAG